MHGLSRALQLLTRREHALPMASGGTATNGVAARNARSSDPSFRQAAPLDGATIAASPSAPPMEAGEAFGRRFVASLIDDIASTVLFYLTELVSAFLMAMAGANCAMQKLSGLCVSRS